MSSSCIKWRSKVVDQFHLYSKIREKRKMGSVQRTISGTSRCVPTKCRAKNERSHEVLLICGFHFSPDPGCFGLFFVSFFLLFSFSTISLENPQNGALMEISSMISLLLVRLIQRGLSFIGAPKLLPIPDFIGITH